MPFTTDLQGALQGEKRDHKQSCVVLSGDDLATAVSVTVRFVVIVMKTPIQQELDSHQQLISLLPF